MSIDSSIIKKFTYLTGNYCEEDLDGCVTLVVVYDR